jgi:predicted DNA-binding protein
MKAASLTSSLLVTKGTAAPSAERAPLDLVGNVQSLPQPPRERVGAGEERMRVSLRMSAERHLRLRLAAAHLGRSNHALMLAAIDHYIDTVLPLLMAGHCACLDQGRMPVGSCTALGFGRTHPDHPTRPDQTQ